MIRILAAAGVAALLALPTRAQADDFSLSYDVDRVPTAKLSLGACRSAIARAADALGYTTRVDQNQGTLVTHVSGPRQDGRSLVAYCIAAGDQTVFVVQAFDYTGPGSADVDRIKAQVATEIRKAAR